MKQASVILGIVGGALKILSAVMLLCIAGFMFPMLLSLGSRNSAVNSEQVLRMLQSIYSIIAIPIGIGGVLGLIGGLTVKKNNTTGGVLMIIGTVLGFDVLLLLGSIFAFMHEKQPVPPYPYPPYPPYPYMPYPPYMGQQPYAPPNPPNPNGGQDPPQDNGQQ